jgi:hypothetical protein
MIVKTEKDKEYLSLSRGNDGEINAIVLYKSLKDENSNFDLVGYKFSFVLEKKIWLSNDMTKRWIWTVGETHYLTGGTLYSVDNDKVLIIKEIFGE